MRQGVAGTRRSQEAQLRFKEDNQPPWGSAGPLSWTCQVSFFWRKPEIQIFIWNVLIETFWQLIFWNVFKHVEGWNLPTSHMFVTSAFRNYRMWSQGLSGNTFSFSRGSVYRLVYSERWLFCAFKPYRKECRVTLRLRAACHIYIVAF